MGTIEAGLFILVLALALGFMLLSFRMSPVFRIIAMIMFFIMSLWMFTGNDVAYSSTTFDSQTGDTLNTTKYIIKNADFSNNWLGWIFTILGIINGFLFFVEAIASR